MADRFGIITAMAPLSLRIRIFALVYDYLVETRIELPPSRSGRDIAYD